MTIYTEGIYTVSQFKKDNPALAKQAERAMKLLKEYPLDGIKFVVIEVEGYNCVANLCDAFFPYELSKPIVPFDENQIYPVQGLVTKYAFQR